MNDYCEIIGAVWIRGYRVRVTFDNLRTAELDLEKYLGRGVFKKLKGVENFKRLRVDAELGTIVWPNGADIAPEVLYQDYLLTRKPDFRDAFTSRQGHDAAAVKEPAKRYKRKK